MSLTKEKFYAKIFCLNQRAQVKIDDREGEKADYGYRRTKDDPKFLYSLAGKIGAKVSKNINLSAYAPSEIFPLLVKNLFTGNIFIDNYPRIDKNYIL